MNKEIKKEWVEALRSGDYTQGRGRLRSANYEDSDGSYSYCCLGVLADILPQTKDTDYWKDKGSLLYDEKYFRSQLPRDIADEIGFTQGTQPELINLNDGDQMNFNQIADYIEGNL